MARRHALGPADEDLVHALDGRRSVDEALQGPSMARLAAALRLARRDVDQRQGSLIFEVATGLRYVEHHAGHAAVAANQREL